MSKMNTTNINNTIDALWVMGGANVLKDNSKNVIGYTCYCDKCKAKSASGNGGISFITAEELLEHRNMKAFKCPSGCGFHVCEERGSIMRHLNEFHWEVMSKLEKDGLDPKKSWIVPDYGNHTYTLNKPTNTSKKFMPDFDDKSPIENAAAILQQSAKNVENKSGVIQMKHPKRVVASPSPNTSPTPYHFANAKSWDKVIKTTPVPLSDVFTQEQTVSKSEKTILKNEHKGWRHVEQSHFTPLKEIIDEQQHEEDDSEPIHYAQEDMRKEKQCPHGSECSKKDRPFACAMNHDGLGDIIKMGTILSEDIICPYERPGFKRCYNGHCTKIHLEGRVEFIEKKKKAYFENKQQTNDNVSDNDDSSVYVDATGISYKCSTRDALAIQAAKRELENIVLDSHDGDWIVPKKSSKPKNTNKPDDSLTIQNLMSGLTVEA